MNKGVSSLLKIIFGVFLILFGAIGHLIPLLPGGIIIVAGILLLAESIPAVRRGLNKVEKRYPAFHKAVNRARRSDGTLDLLKIVLVLVAIIVIFGIIVYLLYRVPSQ